MKKPRKRFYPPRQWSIWHSELRSDLPRRRYATLKKAQDAAIKLIPWEKTNTVLQVYRPRGGGIWELRRTLAGIVILQ